MPEGSAFRGAALNGLKLLIGDEEVEAPAGLPPVPPPVKLALLGPIGRDPSVKAQVLEVQMQLPAMGSQKGVEQLVGTRVTNK